jgi:hypothetical protein
MKNIQKTELWLITDKRLEYLDGTYLRGYFANLYTNRPEFHGHIKDKFLYRHPMIQFKIINGIALVTGIEEGAYLLKAVPEIKELHLGGENYSVLSNTKKSDTVAFGITSDKITYSFITPWLGLNDKNYEIYLNIKHDKTKRLNHLKRIIIGNILSISKGIGYVVEERIEIDNINLVEVGMKNPKGNLHLLGFTGEFRTNFYLPDLWGIGKFSSRGYGTIRCEKIISP